jgi:hypothetical protein
MESLLNIHLDIRAATARRMDVQVCILSLVLGLGQLSKVTGGALGQKDLGQVSTQLVELVTSVAQHY